MELPKVIGFELSGELPPGTNPNLNPGSALRDQKPPSQSESDLTALSRCAGSTATDAVLHITNIVRKHGAVGQIVEFYGNGILVIWLGL